MIKAVVVAFCPFKTLKGPQIVTGWGIRKEKKKHTMHYMSTVFIANYNAIPAKENDNTGSTRKTYSSEAQSGKMYFKFLKIWSTSVPFFKTLYWLPVLLFPWSLLSWEDKVNRLAGKSWVLISAPTWGINKQIFVMFPEEENSGCFFISISSISICVLGPNTTSRI